MAGYAQIIAAAAGATAGGIIGAQKNRYRLLEEERRGREIGLGALNNYEQLVGAGANQSDVSNAATASREFAQLLRGYQNNGLYDMQTGQSMAEQQYAPQRDYLNALIQQQIQDANKAAAMQGRNTNDPVLRARLAQQQNLQLLGLQSQQQQAAMGYARQAVTDRIGVGAQRVGVMNDLSQQAFTNYSNLYNMSSNLVNNERNFSLNRPAEGGGWMGALTGAMQGAAYGNAAFSGGNAPTPTQGGTNSQTSQIAGYNPQYSASGGQFNTPQSGGNIFGVNNFQGFGGGA